MFGKSGNPKAFLVISDGQAWSGTVATALQEARARKIPVHVAGIGTTTGGMIPEPARPDGTRPPPVVRSVLDRNSLVQIAVAGGGEYFEIGDEPDRVVAFRIIDRLHRQSDVSQQVESFEDLYRRFLMAAAVDARPGHAVPAQAQPTWRGRRAGSPSPSSCSRRWSRDEARPGPAGTRARVAKTRFDCRKRGDMSPTLTC